MNGFLSRHQRPISRERYCTNCMYISNSKVTKLKQRKRFAIGGMHIIHRRILCLPQFILFSFGIIVRDCVLYGSSRSRNFEELLQHEPSICASNKYFTGYPLDFFVFCAVFPCYAAIPQSLQLVVSHHDSLSASRITRKVLISPVSNIKNSPFSLFHLNPLKQNDVGIVQ